MADRVTSIADVLESSGDRPDRLKAQLIAGLIELVSKTEITEYKLKRFQEQLHKRLRDLLEQTLNAADSITTLQYNRRELKARAQNLGKAIAKMRHSATLLQQLADNLFSTVQWSCIGRGTL